MTEIFISNILTTNTDKKCNKNKTFILNWRSSRNNAHYSELLAGFLFSHLINILFYYFSQTKIISYSEISFLAIKTVRFSLLQFVGRIQEKKQRRRRRAKRTAATQSVRMRRRWSSSTTSRGRWCCRSFILWRPRSLGTDQNRTLSSDRYRRTRDDPGSDGSEGFCYFWNVRRVFVTSSSSSSSSGVWDCGAQPAALRPGPVRWRAAAVDPLAVWGPGGQHRGGAAEAGLGSAGPPAGPDALRLDLDLQRPVRRTGLERKL